MRSLGMMALLGLAACAGPGAGHGGGGMPSSDGGERPSERSVGQEIREAPNDGPFAGVWETCEGATSPEECSRYLLVQRGDRICGTWSYLASGKAYDGRLIARATSATQARRTHVCGRPGAETDTECGDGWQSVDRPLLLCEGKLGDLASAYGDCVADYQAVPAPQDEWQALLAEPWVLDCLSNAP